MSAIWIVVSDTSRARIFAAEPGRSAMVEVHTLAHPAARLHEGDLVSDKAGREWDGGTTSHGMNGEMGAKEEEEIRFASEVCQVLESGRTSGQFEKIYIIAAPGFLGTLRKLQSSSLQKLVTAEIPKNLAEHDVSDIRNHLPERL